MKVVVSGNLPRLHRGVVLSLNNMKKFIQNRRDEIQRGREEFALDKVKRQKRRLKKLGSLPDSTGKTVRMGLMNKQHPMELMRTEWERRKQLREERYGRE